MRLGIVGCGYVSSLYLRTLLLRPQLRIVGATDLVPERSRAFARRAGCPVFDSVEDLLARGDVEMVVNLTNPREHYAINQAALRAGKHVYSEKPLAMDFSQAQQLVELGRTRGLRVSGAPCNVLGEVAQGVWRELRCDAIGQPRLVYAELDDGMIHRAPYQRWFNELGVAWPVRDEFEVGCTLEHAGYYLTWLAAFFGPAESVTRFGATLISEKIKGETLRVASPDLTVACITYRTGVVARLTCSIVSEHDHRLRIVGDDGVISVRDCWDYRSEANVKRWVNVRRRLMLSPFYRSIRLASTPGRRLSRFGAATMDFARGIAELADAIRSERPSRLSPEFCLHVNELALAIHQGKDEPGVYRLTTDFCPMAPMPWAL